MSSRLLLALVASLSVIQLSSVARADDPPPAATPPAAGNSSLEDEMRAMEASAPPEGAVTTTTATSTTTTTVAAPENATLSDEQALYAERTGVEQHRDSTDPIELEGENYYFFGPLYRQIFVAPGIVELFVDRAMPVFNPGVGGEFTYRKNGFSIGANVWWQDLSFRGPFLASGDPDENTEFLNSNWQSIFASASFLWSTEFNKYIAFEYGLEAGLGVITGDMTRTEGYPNNGPGSVNGFSPCSGMNMNPIGYCGATSSGGLTDADGENGEHYGVVARKWSQGGSVPNVVPWLTPRIGLRIKPIRQIQIRIDTGFMGFFFFGGSLSYGF
jgi:hypothetical protein